MRHRQHITVRRVSSLYRMFTRNSEHCCEKYHDTPGSPEAVSSNGILTEWLPVDFKNTTLDCKMDH